MEAIKIIKLYTIGVLFFFLGIIGILFYYHGNDLLLNFYYLDLEDVNVVETNILGMSMTLTDTHLNLNRIFFVSLLMFVIAFLFLGYSFSKTLEVSKIVIQQAKD